MPALLISLLPEIIVSLIYPSWIIFTVLLTTGKHGTRHALMFIAGGSFTRLLQGLIFGLIIGTTHAIRGDEFNGTLPITAMFYVFIGLLMLITGIRTYLHQPDMDAPPPKWLSRVEGLSSIELFLVGAGWVLISPKFWAMTLSAISKTFYSGLGSVDIVTAFIFYIVGCVLISLFVIVFAMLQANASHPRLHRFHDWLGKNTRHIIMAVSGIFGVLFLYLGITGLIGFN